MSKESIPKSAILYLSLGGLMIAFQRFS